MRAGTKTGAEALNEEELLMLLPVTSLLNPSVDAWGGYSLIGV